MSTLISSDNIQEETLASFTGGPTITNVQITDSSYNVIDDTAVPLAGGYIKITGTKFAAGAEVLFNNIYATSVIVVSSTVIHAQVGAQAAGTYILYVTNTDGGTAIRVNGITFSGNPIWVTGSTLPTNSVGSVISIQLSATGDAPITYQVQTGSTLPTGLTLSSSGLLSGTITGLSSETTYNFTIEALDNELQESPRTFSITITVGDLYWDNVTTLLSSTATPFTSMLSSSSVFELNPMGDTRPNNFNPYSGNYYSVYFDGTGDNLSTPANSALAFGTGDFTVEFWINFTSTTVRQDIIWWGVSASDRGGLIYNELAGNLTYYISPTVARAINYAWTPMVGVWYHIALVRISGSSKLYVNGVQVSSTYADSKDYASSSYLVTIGKDNSAASSYLFGNISNLRIVKGTGVYTTTFTPSTVPLTAISGTSLLTCQSNRFIDNSPNNFTITVTGDTRITAFIPFAQNSSYSTYGSTYFDGTGDYIRAGSSADIVAITTGQFTIECWIYPTNASLKIMAGYSYWSIGQNGGWRFYINASNFLRLDASTATYNSYPTVITATTPVILNAWNHVAAVRNSSNQINLYVNGAVAATPVTYSASLDLASAGRQQLFTVGGVLADGTLYDTVTGYITDVRVIQGTAVYTSAFTPPSQPLSLVTNTVMLTCQGNQPIDSKSLLDDSGSNLLMTRFGNITQGSFSPYGESWSIYFDGTGDYINLLANSNYALGTGNFTVEFWIFNTTALDTNNRCVLNMNSGGFFVQIRNNAIGIGVAGSTENNAFTFSMQANTWYHIAISRTGSTVYGFVNGTLISSASNSVNYAQNGLWIGGLFNGTQLVFGYISNIRIVKGTGLYTSSFNPSSSPLQAISGTILLACESNNFLDVSPIAASITVNGDPRVQRFSPFAGALLPTPYYSAYFDGSGDYLTVPSNAAFAFGTSDFTIEFWHFTLARTQIYPALVSNQATAAWGTNKWAFFDRHNDNPTKYSFYVYNYSTTTPVITSTLLPQNNTWYHIALVRSGSTFRLYINGTLDTTYTNTNSIDAGTSQPFGIGYSDASSTAYHGYISNVRVVNGTAVYTANFTPPTQPLTSVAGTSLLTCQSSTFIDNSTNNFAITVVGNSRPTTLNPFTMQYSLYNAYSPSTIGGSIYGDNDGDYVIVPGQGSSFLNPALGLGTTDFTVECWVYPMNDNQVWLWDFRYSGGGSGQNRPMLSISLTQAIYYTGTTARITNTYSTRQYAWTHFAIVRGSGVTTMYINGVATGSTYSASDDFGSTNTLTIGTVGDSPGYSATELIGYISDVRVVRSAVYTSNFVVPNVPLTNINNTAFLGNMSNFGIYDSSMDINFETFGNTKLSTVIKKYNSSSMYFDGTGDYLVGYSPTVNLYALGTGDFTIETWFYVASTTNQCFVDFRTSSTATDGFFFGLAANGYIQVYANANIIYTAVSLSINTWYHVALVRSAGTMAIYINGTSVATTANSTNFTNGIYRIGSSIDATANLNGYLDDLRLTKGIARYTSNFTAPTSALFRQ